MACLGKDTPPPPENEGMSRENGPFQKERLVFQLSCFRGEVLVFWGGHQSGLGGGFQVFFMFTYVYIVLARIIQDFLMELSLR